MSMFTEEELKKILKSLFTEKKRVKELQKQLEEKEVQKKFHTKLTDIHKLSLTEEYAKLKTAYFEKEKECELFHTQLAKVKPALKKLILDLKEAKAETLKQLNEINPKLEELKKVLEEKDALLQLCQEKIFFLEKEKSIFEEEKKQTACRDPHPSTEQVASLLSDLDKEKKLFSDFQKKSEVTIFELEKALSQEQSENKRFEAERGKLVERLADVLSQIQRQSEIIKELKDEIKTTEVSAKCAQEKAASYEKQIEELKEELSKTVFESVQMKSSVEEKAAYERKDKEALQNALIHLEKENLLLKKDLEEDRAHLQEIDFSALKGEVAALNVEKTQLIEENEKLKKEKTVLHKQHDEIFQEKELALENTYLKMRELFHARATLLEEKEQLHAQCEEKSERLIKLEKEMSQVKPVIQNMKVLLEEKDGDLRKAQYTIAKKVKETTLVKDLSERQKMEIRDLQEGIRKVKSDIERMEHHLNHQRLNDEKSKEIAQERIQALEAVSKDWQDKYLNLHEDWQEKNRELAELQKIRKSHEQMALTFLNLKSLISKNGETLSDENPPKNL